MYFNLLPLFSLLIFNCSSLTDLFELAPEHIRVCV